MKQGRIHGHQLRTGGQGRKCAFSQFSTRWLRTDRRTDGPTDRRTDKASYRVACPQLKMSANLPQAKRQFLFHAAKDFQNIWHWTRSGSLWRNSSRKIQLAPSRLGQFFENTPQTSLIPLQETSFAMHAQFMEIFGKQ